MDVNYMDTILVFGWKVNTRKGVESMGKTVQFTHVSDQEDCGIIFYDRKTGKETFRKAFLPEERIGRTYRKKLTLEDKAVTYQFYEGEKRVPDKKGRAFVSTKKYGEVKETEDVYTLMETSNFDWKGSKQP